MAEAPLEQADTAPTSSPKGLFLMLPAVLVAGVLGLYLASAVLTGELGRLTDPDDPVALSRYFRANLVMLVVMAYALAVWLHSPEATRGELDRVRPVVDADDREFASLSRAILVPRSAVGWVAGAGVAIAVYVLSDLVQNGTLDLPWTHEDRWDINNWWTLPIMLGMFSVMGAHAQGSVRMARGFSQIGQRARVQLLRREDLTPFAQCGLRLSRYWFVGSAIALLLVFDLRVPGLVLGVIVATVALGVATLLLPCVGVHRKLRVAKAEELDRVRSAIEEGRDALLRPGASEPAGDLPALLAYEARVQAVGEWPFGTPTLLRFALLVLLPLGSWVAGALVERLVEALLS